MRSAYTYRICAAACRNVLFGVIGHTFCLCLPIPTYPPMPYGDPPDQGLYPFIQNIPYTQMLCFGWIHLILFGTFHAFYLLRTFRDESGSLFLWVAVGTLANGVKISYDNQNVQIDQNVQRKENRWGYWNIARENERFMRG